MLNRFLGQNCALVWLLTVLGLGLALGDRYLLADDDKPQGKPAQAVPAPTKAEQPAERGDPHGPPSANKADRGERRARVGTLVRLNQPVRLDKRIERVVNKAISSARQEGQWPVIIFEIRSGESEFGQALDFAHYLLGKGLEGATTVAYVPEELTGHAVLVALACDEIIMGEEAQLGEAGKNDDVIKDSVRAAYIEIAEGRNTVPSDVALKMLDPAADLRLVETDVSREFVLADRLPDLRKTKRIAKEERLIGPGKPGLFSGERARELGFVSYLANDRQALAKALGLPANAVEEDLALSGPVRPVRIAVKGPISAALTDQIQNLVQTQIHNDANLLVFWIESAGGSPNDSINLANFMVGIDAEERRTVAYIHGVARGDAAYIALACDQIVMRPGSVLGGPGDAPIQKDELDTIARSVSSIAERKHHSPALAAAMVGSPVAVYRYQRETDQLVDFLTEEQHAKLPDAKLWKKGRVVAEANQSLQLTGEQADELGITAAVVEDFAGLKGLYDLERDPRMIEPTWADFLIDALNSPGVSIFLLALGGFALYAELQSPGIGLGGLIAALCFLLYFWSAYLGGTAGWLEVLLFVAGVSCLGLEIFVLPGFGLFGLAGGLLIVASLVLASQTFILPRNDYQFHQLRNSLLIITCSGASVIAAAALMRRYLPQTPVLNNMVLAPPSDEELSIMSQRESLMRLDHLLGQRGTAFTPLVPGGKARIGEELVDVLTDGEFIDRGEQIEVIEVRGNRVVVRGLS